MHACRCRWDGLEYCTLTSLVLPRTRKCWYRQRRPSTTSKASSSSIEQDSSTTGDHHSTHRILPKRANLIPMARFYSASRWLKTSTNMKLRAWTRYTYNYKLSIYIWYIYYTHTQSIYSACIHICFKNNIINHIYYRKLDIFCLSWDTYHPRFSNRRSPIWSSWIESMCRKWSWGPKVCGRSHIHGSTSSYHEPESKTLQRKSLAKFSQTATMAPFSCIHLIDPST